MTSTDQAKKEFWNNDIKVARDYNKTLQNDEARNMEIQFQHGDITPGTHTFIKFYHINFHLTVRIIIRCCS